MSTLPRTRSLSGADTSSLSRKLKPHERIRPSSLCEASWNKIDLSGNASRDMLRRTPSQANNLCTTVPTSIVNKTLGGRHTPTRNSLRHSRMAVMARNAKATPASHWARDTNRVTKLVIISYIVVGAIGSMLALLLLNWVPVLPFKEVPHYSSVAIIVSGILSGVVACLPEHLKHFAKHLKYFLLLLLLLTILSCASVCVFDAMHLITLAPMECQIRHNVVIQRASPEPDTPEPVPGTPEVIPKRPLALSHLDRLILSTNGTNNSMIYPAGDEEGSGISFDGRESMVDDEEGMYPVYENLELDSTSLSTFDATITQDIYINISTCACYKSAQGFKIVKEYPNLTCDDVKNVLPIFLVASCVVMVVGGVLSVVIIYVLWTNIKHTTQPYGPGRPPEFTPFINKNNFNFCNNRQLYNKTPNNVIHLHR